jgi:hypothetical protein
MRQQHLATAPLFTFIRKLTNKSSTRNSNGAVILAHAPAMKSKLSLDPFSRHHSPWFLNQENLEIFMLYITSPIPAFLRFDSLQLITQLTLTCTPAPGVPFRLYVILFITYPQALKPLSAMLLKHTIPSLSLTPNGQVSWSNYETKTRSQSTPATTLA